MNGDELNRSVAQLLTNQAGMSADVKGLTARLNDWVDRNEKKHETHFGQHATLSKQVAAIERDYVPEKRLERHEREQRDDLSEMSKEIASLKVGMAKVVAGAVVVLAGVQLVVSWWMR